MAVQDVLDMSSSSTPVQYSCFYQVITVRKCSISAHVLHTRYGAATPAQYRNTLLAEQLYIAVLYGVQKVFYIGSPPYQHRPLDRYSTLSVPCKVDERMVVLGRWVDMCERERE